ncbi:MAG: sodium:proton antiporter, partial [Algisphaera sp.]
VVATTALVGGGMYLLTQGLGLDLPMIYCLLFGSLIAPTDPIAVLAIMKKVGAPRGIETKLAGESLFNDGVGVVVFLALLGFVAPGHDPHGTGAHTAGHNPPALIAELADAAHSSPASEHVPNAPGVVGPMEQTAASDSTPAPGFGHDDVKEGRIDWSRVRDIAKLFTIEAGGGLLLGGLLGGIAFVLLRSCDEYQTEILITLALVFGGYVLAQWLHVSGPLAMVVAGLLIGNPGRSRAMSEHTREHLDSFWELIDAMLNAVLFVLIGLEVIVLSLRSDYLLAGALAVPMVLLCRFVAVGSIVAVLRQFRSFSPHTVKVMAWAGLRGGISIAMALALKEHAIDNPAAGELVLTVTYVVVACSIILQGLTVGPLLRVCGLAGRHDPYAE